MDWIEELKLMRQTLFSSVIICETDDVRRFQALIEKQPNLMNVNGKEKWMTLENWKGLYEANKMANGEVKWDKVKDVKQGGGDIMYLLDDANKHIMEKPTVLVVKNILEANHTLNNTFLSWATDVEIMDKGSTIIIFLEDRSILPQSVWSHMKIVSPPKSTESERKRDIDNAIDSGAIKAMDGKEKLNATQLLAGCNLDQIDALITEISIRNRHRMDMGLLAQMKVDLMSKDPAIDVVNPPKFGFDAIGGYNSLKQRIIDEVIIPLKNPKYAKMYNISTPRGLLLYGPPGCFVENTNVVMHNGTIRPIEEFGTQHLQPIDEKIKTIKGKDTATQFHVYEDTLCYEVTTNTGRTVECSYNQPFWLEEFGWLRADCLNAGDKVRTTNKYEKIKTIKQIGKKTVYDITTQNHHEFIANGFRVHNTGKSLFTKALSKELNMTQIRMQPEKIFHKYVGESEKSLRRIFKTADAMSPCIVSIEELDRYGRRSTSSGNDSSGGTQVNRQIFSMLLEKLGDEDRNWFFVANTNLIEVIDPAMRRTGRIDSIVPVPFPDKDARVEILKIHSTMKRNLPLDKIDYNELAKETEMWTGSDVEQLVIRTANTKMINSVKKDKAEKITQDDFLEAVKTFNVDVDGNRKIQKDMENKAKQYTNDKRLMDVFKEAESSSQFKTRYQKMADKEEKE